jgi:hypothetical protein
MHMERQINMIPVGYIACNALHIECLTNVLCFNDSLSHIHTLRILKP